MQETFTISELGKEFGITTRAIRFYEDKQLLNPAREGQKRVYSRADRTRLKLLLRGKRLGWPLDEIRIVLDMYDTSNEGELKQLEYTCRKIEESRQILKAQREDLEEAMHDLGKIETRCRERIAAINADENAA